MNEYYTYAYLREDGIPYYIGKGKGNRAFKKHNIKVPPKDKILFLKKNLSEKEALKHEKYIIFILGRKDLGTGKLENKTSGGNGVSGKVYSQKEKERIRNSVLGKKWWNNGIKNVHSRECPGDEWSAGRLITWDENKRLENMKEGASKTSYKFTHINGEIAYCKNLNDLKRICNTEGFYKLLYKQQKSYKGWISIEKCDNKDVECDYQKIIDLCNSYIKKTYKITHKDGRIMYCTDIIKLGKEYGSLDGFGRVMRGTRKSYKGWISVEVI